MNVLKGFFVNLNGASTIYGSLTAESIRDTAGKVDVLVIGGGLCGLVTAFELAKAGKSVLVAEKDRIGAGPSGRSGGQMWPGFEGSYSKMVEDFGVETATAAWQAIHEGMKYIHSDLLITHPTNCDFSPGVLLVSKTQRQAEWIQQEAQTMQKAGFGWVSYVDKLGLKAHLNTTVYHDAMLFEGEVGAQYGHLNPLLYVQQVAKLAKEAGALIAEKSPVTAIRQNPEGRYIVTTPQGEIEAGQVVLAAGSGFVRPQGMGFDVVPRFYQPVQTVILATEPMSPEVAAKVVPGFACFADAADSAMTYGRMTPANDGTNRLIFTFGGADAVAQMQCSLEAKRLEAEMYRTYPALKEHGIKVSARWGGNCDLSRSALPVLAEVQGGLTYVGGFSGQGMIATATYGRAIAEKLATGACETFKVLSGISPKAFSPNAVKAKFQLLAQVAPDIVKGIKDSYAERNRIGAAEKAPA